MRYCQYAKSFDQIQVKVLTKGMQRDWKTLRADSNVNRATLYHKFVE